MVGGTVSNLKHKRNRWAFVAITASFTKKEPIEPFLLRSQSMKQISH